MINLNFAPNENFRDAGKAVRILVQPKNWYRENEVNQSRRLLANLAHTSIENIHFTLAARSGLYGILKTLSLPKKSEILVQGFTCEAVVLPIISLGLVPKYIDIETQTFSMSLESLQEQITQQSKVLILQHSFGMLPAHRKKILRFAQERKIIVIEDLAHGFHPEVFNKDSSQSFKLLSFGRSKMFSSVFGGAVIIPEPYLDRETHNFFDNLPYPSRAFIFRALLYKIYSPIILINQQNIFGKLLYKLVHTLQLFSTEISLQEKNGHYDPWLEKKLPSALAQFVHHNLSKYSELIAARTQIANYYQSVWDSNKTLLSVPLLRFPLLIKNRPVILCAMKNEGIELGTWYEQPIAPLDFDLAQAGYFKGTCPVAEKVCEQIINLPLRVHPSTAQIIIQKLKRLS